MVSNLMTFVGFLRFFTFDFAAMAFVAVALPRMFFRDRFSSFNSGISLIDSLYFLKTAIIAVAAALRLARRLFSVAMFLRFFLSLYRLSFPVS